MASYSEQFLNKTIEIWQPHCSVPLTIEDAQEITNNMVDLFTYLNELRHKYDQKET